MLQFSSLTALELLLLAKQIHVRPVPLDIILQAGSWKGDCTFRKFYNKPIEGNVSKFGQAILGFSPGE